jgi:hypothetical protein
MCEICELEKMMSDKKSDIKVLQNKVIEIGNKYGALWSNVPKCDDVNRFVSGYWHGFYHALRWAVMFPLDMQRLNETEYPIK